MGGNMPTGLYRDDDEWVMVNYGQHQAPIPRARYESEGYSPPYVELPTKQQYDALRGAK